MTPPSMMTIAITQAKTGLSIKKFAMSRVRYSGVTLEGATFIDARLRPETEES